MGKPKFTVGEGRRIVEFIHTWRKKNPDAVEWPLEEIQDKLDVKFYSFVSLAKILTYHTFQDSAKV